MNSPAVNLDPITLAYALPGGLASLATNGKWKYAKHLKLIEDKLLDIHDGKNGRLLVSMPPRHGKLCANSTPVLTTEGWKTHGELKVGDYVFGRDGNPTKVIATSQEDFATISVEIWDGKTTETIKCHPNHEWLVKQRGTGKWSVTETKKLMQRENARTASGRALFHLDYAVTIQFEDVDLPIDPYVLGAWLGDGTYSVPRITTSDEEIFDEIKRRGFDFASKNYHLQTGVPTQGFQFLHQLLKDNNLIKNKHIPDIYLTASVEQKLEFLAGIIDTDGCVDKDTGRIRIVNTNPNIVFPLIDIIRSLGHRVSVGKVPPCTSSSGIKGNLPVYTVSFYSKFNIPTVVQRKNVMPSRHVRRLRGIKSIKSCDPELGRCIQVDAKDGIYLVGKTLIPTHNSSLISHYFPAWYLGRNPDKYVIFVSYQAEYAKSWGRKTRNVLAQHGEQVFGIKVSPDVAAASHWEIEGHTGGMETVGAEGALTGKGADLLILDDIVKGREQALNARTMANQFEWFQSDVYTRLQKGGSIIGVATRWSPEDFIGRLLDEQANGGDLYEYLSLAALAEENDVLGRKEGEALWPEQFDRDKLIQNRRVMGTYWFTSQYQQRPSSLAGDIIKIEWFRRYDTAPAEPEQYILSFDTAQKEAEIHDYTVCTVWACYKNSYYLVDLIREKLNHPRLLALTKNLNTKWKPTAILIENKGSGISLIQHLQDETSAPAIAIEPTVDKAIRMQNETPLIEAGQVYLPKEGTVPWLADFEDEVRGFPNSTRKDQVDSLSQFLKWVRERGGSGVEMF